MSADRKLLQEPDSAGVGVTYTCGAMWQKDQIVLPYAVSDTFSNFATIKISAAADDERLIVACKVAPANLPVVKGGPHGP
jgi:hypothetical protein